MNVFDEFRWRDAIFDSTDGLEELLLSEPQTVYIGFDPTASSLHVGSLLPIMTLARVQRCGHSPLAIVGGGTGMIGDPSGKSAERNLLTRERLEENVLGLRSQLERFLDFETPTNPAQIVNNIDWLGEIRMMDFLRKYGKHFTVNSMLAKESVKRRIEGEDGISYTEFSYMLLQSWDFLELFDRYGCRVQMGGSDQWGNITAGIDLIRKLRGERCHALVFPLLTNSSGEKFGKSQGGNVWLDAELTPPFRFYQFWKNTEDADVIRLLKLFTFVDRAEIDELAEATEEAPERRAAQIRLASELTELVHGATALARAEAATRILFDGADVADATAEELLEIFSDVPSSEVPGADLAGDGASMIDLLDASGLAKSKGEARRLLRQGGVYLNNRKVADETARVEIDQAIDGRLLVLRKGKRAYHLVRVLGS